MRQGMGGASLERFAVNVSQLSVGAKPVPSGINDVWQRTNREHCKSIHSPRIGRGTPRIWSVFTPTFSMPCRPLACSAARLVGLADGACYLTPCQPGAIVLR